MLSDKRVISYELNEVPARVLQTFITLRPNSELARLWKGSRFWTTVTTDKGQLVPWSSWSTLHRGVNNEAHGVSDLGQDLRELDKEFPPIWRILAESGVKTGVFGSLNSYPLPENVSDYSFYVPDTFAAGPECFPSDLSVFQDFNLRMVDLNGRNTSASIVLKPAFDLMRRAPGLGLRGATLGRLGRQLITERINPARRCRRRTSQVELAFDLFLKQLERSVPDFGSFFTNHVASSMHRYWPALFRDDYLVKEMPDGWQDQFCNEILYTMTVASRQIGDLMKFVERRRAAGYVLMISSSMGQAAVDNDEIIHSQLFVSDCDKLMSWLGIKSEDWEARRAMLPRYVFAVAPHVAPRLREKLNAVTINGMPLKHVEHEHCVFTIKVGHPNLDSDSIEVKMDGQVFAPEQVGMKNTLIPDSTGSYAYHIPEGVMLIYDPNEPNAEKPDTKLSTTEIAPAILRNYGLDVPSYMPS